MNPEELKARHQGVRAFVEQQYPGNLVTEIVERAKTTYREPRQGDVYVLASAEDECDIAAHNVVVKSGIRCKVTLLEDGSLRAWDVQHVGYFP